MIQKLFPVKLDGSVLDVPVDGDIVLDMVGNPDQHIIAFPRVKCWPWKFPIHSNDSFARAQLCAIFHHNLNNNEIQKKKLLLYKVENICK